MRVISLGGMKPSRLEGLKPRPLQELPRSTESPGGVQWPLGSASGTALAASDSLPAVGQLSPQWGSLLKVLRVSRTIGTPPGTQLKRLRDLLSCLGRLAGFMKTGSQSLKAESSRRGEAGLRVKRRRPSGCLGGKPPGNDGL